jgi:hypothetical protein
MRILSVPNRAELINELRERALHLLAEMPRAEAAAEKLMELVQERWVVKTGGQGDAAKRVPAKAAVAKGKKPEHGATPRPVATTPTASREDDPGQARGQQQDADSLADQWGTFKREISILHQQIRRALKILSADDPLRERLERLSLCRGGGLSMDELHEELDLIVELTTPGSGLPMTTSGNDPMQVEPGSETDLPISRPRGRPRKFSDSQKHEFLQMRQEGATILQIARRMYPGQVPDPGVLHRVRSNLNLWSKQFAPKPGGERHSKRR